MTHSSYRRISRAGVTLGSLLICAVAVSEDETAAGAGYIGSADELLSAEEVAHEFGVDRSVVGNGPVDGLYEIVIDTNISYVTKDGRYLIRGNVFEIESREDLTERRASQARADLLSTIDNSTAIVFSPQDGPVKHRITVFTDVDCGYCRQMHSEVEQITSQGIEVRYVSWPRSGTASEAWMKAAIVWCAPDRQAALTAAKLGRALPPVSTDCDTNSITGHYLLGERMGVSGTPAIFTDNGQHVGGYLLPDEILGIIEEAEQK